MILLLSACFEDEVQLNPVRTLELASKVSVGPLNSCGLIGTELHCRGKYGDSPTTLRDGSPLLRVATTAISLDEVCAALNDGRMICFGEEPPEPALDWIDFSVEHLAIGSGFRCALLADKRVACAGNTSWTTAKPTLVVDAETDLELSDVRSIRAGNSHVCALLETGAVRCWGDNSRSQLGYTTSEAQSRAGAPGIVATGISVGSTHTCAVVESGEIACWGDNQTGQSAPPNVGEQAQPALPSGNPAARINEPRLVDGLTAMVEVAAGGYHSCARNVQNEILCWGYNGNGQLGDGKQAYLSHAPQRVDTDGVPLSGIGAGLGHTCRIERNGDTYCWGANLDGQVQ